MVHQTILTGMLYDKISLLLSSLRSTHKENNERKELSYINSQFQVTEMNGSMYLTCNDVPFHKLDYSISVREVISKLNEARSSAIEYRKSGLNNRNSVVGETV